MRIMSALLVASSALLASCGGLSNPVPAATGCAQVTAAVQAKCGAGTTFDCNVITACGADGKEWEKADTDACATNINAAADCDAAKNVSCSIACTQ
jgi:hypothetical protein